ncbi:hypothetical protein LAZ67_9000148 [Cordylochernes scorpioides]|uniref:Uncharacterized protein n=1 Tax=Cordylochernes scorpioides TaxID=51811 RepID=A0ABY6KV37_9ARAC|nr:hypothetical protein LAZ67_9000148 [Cordylochernes scorpioides]
MAHEFKNWCDQMRLIDSIKIPRYMWNDLVLLTEIRVLCNASQVAYEAVAYLRSEVDGRCNTTLIWSKTRLTPIKRIIPRLELMAIVLGARLANSIQAAHERKCEIEHLINNRPLTYVSEDDNHIKLLKPNEFLQSGPEPSLPEL